MVQEHLNGAPSSEIHTRITVVRHSQVRKKLQVSSAKLFDMIARGQFPKPFTLVPNGRAVGWLEHEVDKWILDRKNSTEMGAI
jgi:prophage regulatory protein